MLACTFTACEKTELPPPNAGEPNAVSGIAVDAQGKPLTGVKVRAENPNGNNIHVEAATNAGGKYSLQVASIGG